MPSSLLEERVAMYLQAIEYATAANDNTRREALEKDIQVNFWKYIRFVKPNACSIHTKIKMTFR